MKSSLPEHYIQRYLLQQYGRGTETIHLLLAICAAATVLALLWGAIALKDRVFSGKMADDSVKQLPTNPSSALEAGAALVAPNC